MTGYEMDFLAGGRTLRRGYATLRLENGGRPQAAFVMRGPSGTHSLAQIATDAGRLGAHWRVFACHPLNKAVTCADDARAFLSELVERGWLWHPDEHPRDCLASHRLSPLTLAALANQMASARRYLGAIGEDVCEVALGLVNAGAEG